MTNMKADTLLSVLIPVYGVEKYIERCAESLFSQAITEGIEFIFVDDKTPDGSLAVLQSVIDRYPDRKTQVKIIHHETNQGLAGSRITGLRHASGKYVIMCDSDDWVESDMYALMLDAAAESDADMVLCHYFVNYPDSEKVFSQTFTTEHDELLRRAIDGEIHCGLWNKMVKREIYEKLQPSFIPGVNMWEDVSVLPRLVHLSEVIAIVDKPLYHYAQMNPQAYTQKWNKKYSEQICKAIEVNVDYFKANGINADKLAQRGLLSILMNESDDSRRRYLRMFRERGLLDKIDYSSMNVYRKLLSRILFGGRFFFLADMIMRSKAMLRKYKIC